MTSSPGGRILKVKHVISDICGTYALISVKKQSCFAKKILSTSQKIYLTFRIWPLISGAKKILSHIIGATCIPLEICTSKTSLEFFCNCQRPFFY